MSLLQTKLNEEAPIGRVFQGSGETDPRDADLKYFQHGLYFKANGDLAVDNVRNADRIALIKSLGVNEAEPEPEVQQPDRAPVNPEIVAKLADNSDAEVFEAAKKLVKSLAASKTKTDYEPTLDARDENIRFIANHVS